MIVSAKITAAHSYRFHITAKTIDDSIANVYARGFTLSGWEELESDYRISENGAESGMRSFAIIVWGINGPASEIALESSSGALWGIPVELTAPESSDDITIVRSSDSLSVVRVPREEINEDYPDPMIGNVGAHSAILMAYPVRRYDPEIPLNEHFSLPDAKYVLYLSASNDGRVKTLTFNSGDKVVEIRPDLDATDAQGRYEVVPVGVTLAGGGMASYNSKNVFNLFG